MTDYRNRPPVDEPRTITINPRAVIGYAFLALGYAASVYLIAVALGWAQ